MDSLSQKSCSEIEAIANLAMSRLESGVQYAWQLEEIYQALLTIRGRAQTTENCINSEAETVGCNHKDKRRTDRLHKFHDMNKQN